MKTKQLIVLFIAVITANLSFGQVGDEGFNQVVYTIGEVAVQEDKQGNIRISEGFIGPDILASLSVADYGQLLGVSIFPNPVQDNLQVQWATTGTYEFYFYDMTGKLIWQQTTSGKQQVVCHLTHWKTGVYLLVIVDRNHHQSTHIKIQKL